MVNIKVDGKIITASEQDTILEACKNAGIYIPTLCYLKEFGPTSSCRICLVEQINNGKLIPACSVKVVDGMEISTNSKKVLDARKINLELILSNHNYDCNNCIKDKKCELQKLANEYNANENKFKGAKTPSIIDDNNYSIVRDNSKCILCKRCILACNNRQEVHAINSSKRGFNTHISSPFELPLNSSNCVNCGQCILACPTGALSEKSNTDIVTKCLKDKTKLKVAAFAPSVRVTIGEEFGLKPGTNVELKLVTALKKLGFDRVFDIDFGADLTIMEEAFEFIERLKTNSNLPMFTSCCPGWVDYVNKFYPELKNNLSTCKSPQQMFGAILKSYYAEKMGINPKDIYMVSIMPCTAKKTELEIVDINSTSYKDIDISITVRELARLMKSKNIDLPKLNDTSFDKLLGDSSGAGVIFGASGGVMEAALRTAADVLTGTNLQKIEYNMVRGMTGIKEAKLNILNSQINIAVASGLGNAKKLIESIISGKKHYHFVEIMACPGGCINGGGTPFITSDEQNFSDYKSKRAIGLYQNDAEKNVRKSHQNPDIIELYNWLGKPNSKKAHSLLHRKY